MRAAAQREVTSQRGREVEQEGPTERDLMCAHIAAWRYEVQQNERSLPPENRAQGRQVTENVAAVENVVLSIPKSRKTRVAMSDYLCEVVLSSIENKRANTSSPGYLQELDRRQKAVEAALREIEGFREWKLKQRPFREWQAGLSELDGQEPFDSSFYHTAMSPIDFDRSMRQFNRRPDSEYANYRYMMMQEQTVQLANTDRFRDGAVSGSYNELLGFMAEDVLRTQEAYQVEAEQGRSYGSALSSFEKAQSTLLEVGKKFVPEAVVHMSPKTEVDNIRRLLTVKSRTMLEARTIAREMGDLCSNAEFLAWQQPDQFVIGLDRIVARVGALLVARTQQLTEASLAGQEMDGKERSGYERGNEGLFEALYRLQQLRGAAYRRARYRAKRGELAVAPDIGEAEEEKRAKPWINVNRERNFAAVISDVEQAREGGESDGDYLLRVLRDFSRVDGQAEKALQFLTAEARSGIHVQMVEDATVAEIAGRRIRRPVITCDDVRAYHALEKIFKEKQGGTHGLHVPASFFDEQSPWGKTGMVLTDGEDAEATTHEIFHSIDPYTSLDDDSRPGYSRLISEMFAFFNEYVYSRQGGVNVKTGVFTPRTVDWNGITMMVSNYSYYETYSKIAKPKMTYDEYRVLVDDCVRSVAAVTQSRGFDGAMDLMAQCETVEQLLAN